MEGLSPVEAVIREIARDTNAVPSDVLSQVASYETGSADAEVFAKQPGESNVDDVHRLVRYLDMSGPALQDIKSLIDRSDFDLSDVIHEIAHWQLSAPSRRSRYGFGLGQSPFFSERDGGTRLVSYDYSLYEESLASLFGILWEAHFDLDYSATIEDHSWYAGIEDATVFLCVLAHNGFLKDGYPTMRCRSKRQRIRHVMPSVCLDNEEW